MSEFVLRASAARTSRMAERVGFEPTCLLTETKRFRGAPVMTTSVPLRIAVKSYSSVSRPGSARLARKKSTSRSDASRARTPPRISKP